MSHFFSRLTPPPLAELLKRPVLPADSSRHCTTCNPPVRAMCKPQTSTPSNVQDRELNSPQRWTAKRQTAIFIDILQGRTTAAKATRRHSLTLDEVDQWRDDFITQATQVYTAISL